jgi:hypothetical protein
MVTAVGSSAVAIVAPAPVIAESVLIPLVGTTGSVGVVPNVAGSLARLWEEVLDGARLTRGTRLVESATLPELAPGTAVVVVPSKIDLLGVFAPVVVVEFVVADNVDDGAGDDDAATNNGTERDDCPEIGYAVDSEVPEETAVDPPLLGPTDPGSGLADAIEDAGGVADPVGTAGDALALDVVTLPGVDAGTLPGVDAVTLPVIGVEFAEIGAVAAALGGGAMAWAAIAGGVV